MRKILVVIAIAAAACGGGTDKGYGQPLTVDATTKTMLSGIVTKAAGVQSVATSPCAGDGLTNLAGLYDSLSILLELKLGKNASGLAPLMREALGSAKPDATGCNAASGTVTFDHFDLGVGTLNGKITYSNGNFTTDLTVTLSTNGTTLTMKMSGTIAVSATALKGELDISANATLSGTTVNVSFSSNYDVTLANNCATGGQIELHADGNGSGQGKTANYDVWVKAVFGPACGDVTVY
jgi:hypothetical protein